MRFWDSSALVPLLVTQASSAQADAWLAQDTELAVWTLTPVELTSALIRLARDGAIEELAAHQAQPRIDELLASCHVVIDTEAVKAQARRLLRVHRLPTGRVFHTLDGRLLGIAARREGFQVMPEPAEANR